MIYGYFRVTGAHDTVLDSADLLTITLRNDDVQEFDTRWTEILLSMTKIPPTSDCQKLKTVVKRREDQKLRSRNFDARNERIEKGAVVASRRGFGGLGRGEGECYQWKAKGQCSRGDQVQFLAR